MRAILFTFLFLFSGLLIAQEASKTKVRFYVKGSTDYRIRIDGELMPSSNIQLIQPGKHQLEVWSPMYELHKGSIEIPKKDSITYFQKLDKDPDYVAFLFDRDQYRRQVFVGRTFPLLISATGTIAAPFFYFLRKRNHERMVIQDFKSDYFADQEAAQTARTRYNASNVIFFTAASMAVGGALSYLLLRKYVNNLKAPVYRQKNPFTLEMFELSYNPVIQAPQGGVTLRF